MPYLFTPPALAAHCPEYHVGGPRRRLPCCARKDMSGRLRPTAASGSPGVRSSAFTRVGLVFPPEGGTPNNTFRASIRNATNAPVEQGVMAATRSTRAETRRRREIPTEPLLPPQRPCVFARDEMREMVDTVHPTAVAEFHMAFCLCGPRCPLWLEDPGFPASRE